MSGTTCDEALYDISWDRHYICMSWAIYNFEYKKVNINCDYRLACIFNPLMPRDAYMHYSYVIIGLGSGLVANLTQSHDQHQCTNILNWTRKHKLPSKFDWNENIYIYIQRKCIWKFCLHNVDHFDQLSTRTRATICIPELHLPWCNSLLDRWVNSLVPGRSDLWFW